VRPTTPRAISFHRRGEIRDRSGEGQHYRIAGMNLLAAIIIFWNTMKLGEVVNTRAPAVPISRLIYSPTSRRWDGNTSI
jgi:TnpA family transposase